MANTIKYRQHLMIIKLNFNKLLLFFYLPGWNIFSELLIDNATNGHDVGIAGNLWSVVHPKVVFKVLAEILEITN